MATKKKEKVKSKTKVKKIKLKLKVVPKKKVTLAKTKAVKKYIDPRQVNMPWLTPYITVADAQRSLDFYKNAFGFRVMDAVKNDKGVLQHVRMTYKNGECVLMFSLEGTFGKMTKTPKCGNYEFPASFYIYCDNVDSMFHKAVNAGATGIINSQDSFLGDRFALVSDPDGYMWSFCKK